MRSLRLSLLPITLFLALTVSATAQEFAVVQKHAFDFNRLRGCSLRIVNGNLYIMNLRGGSVAKVKPWGEEVFSGFLAPRVGRAQYIIAITEDQAGNTYVADGVNIHVYSPKGSYERTLSPGLNLARDGLLVLEPDNLWVAGRVPPNQGAEAGTLHELKGAVVARSFSTPFYPGSKAMEDITLNTDSTWPSIASAASCTSSRSCFTRSVSSARVVNL
jgi:hypothetical protein